MLVWIEIPSPYLENVHNCVAGFRPARIEIYIYSKYRINHAVAGFTPACIEIIANDSHGHGCSNVAGFIPVWIEINMRLSGSNQVQSCRLYFNEAWLFT